MIKINLTDCCMECGDADLHCDYDDLIINGCRRNRDYVVVCDKARVCKHLAEKGVELDDEWWK